MSKPLLIAEGSSDVINFGHPPCQAISVDNYSASWLYFPEANRWVAPYRDGLLLKMPYPMESIRWQWQSPNVPGIAANPTPSGGVAAVTFWQEVPTLEVSPGLNLFTPEMAPGQFLSTTQSNPSPARGAIRTDDGSHPQLGVSGGGRFSDSGLNMGASAFTSRGWIQPQTSATSQCLFCYGDVAGNNFFALFLISATQVTLQTSGGGTPQSFTFTIPNVVDNNWHQWAAKYTPGTTTFTFYYDGSPNGTWVQLAHTSPQGLATMGYNIDNNAPTVAENPGANLGLDRFDFCNRALSDAEVLASFNARVTGTYNQVVLNQAPVRFYPLNDTNTSVMTDIGAQSINGVYSSGATQGVPGI